MLIDISIACICTLILILEKDIAGRYGEQYIGSGDKGSWEYLNRVFTVNTLKLQNCTFVVVL